MSLNDASPAVEIRELRRGDERWLLSLRRENRAFLGPYEPTRPAGFLTPEAQRTYVERSLAAASAAPFAILADGVPVGTVNVSNIVRGAFSSANVGYWVAEAWNGRGVATRAVALVTARAFGTLGLHRLEAGTLLHNVGSQRVLTRNAFRPIGVSRRYLHIGGAWRDHLLFARTADDRPASAAPAAATAAVRDARPGDAAALVALLAVAAADPVTAMDPVPGGVRAERRRLVDLGSSRDALVLVAERGGAVVGRLDLRRDAHPAARHVAEVGFVVDPGARRSGVARTLLAAAARRAVDADVTRFEAYAAPANRPAVGLLDALGWRVEGFRAGRFRGPAGPVDMLILSLDLESS